MQTPQGFERNVLLRSLRAAERELTDDAEALLSLGRKVFTVRGEAANLKVTTNDDLVLAEAIARALLGRAGGLPSAERERPSRRGLAPGEEE
jgi:2-C-methyl-D-erythritol 4-phosphate cytidylyltransferase